MTRRKQPPQKFNSENESEKNDKSSLPAKKENASPVTGPIQLSANELQTNSEQKDKTTHGMAKSPVSATKGADSCQKLLDFTQNFSFAHERKSNSLMKQENPDLPENKREAPSLEKAPLTPSSEESSTTRSSSVVLSYRNREKSPGVRREDSEPSEKPEDRARIENGVALNGSAQSLPISPADMTKLLANPDVDLFKGLDLTSLTAAHKFLMDTVQQQQKQVYEHYTNNWMNVQQRSDNNCLSKSKAERYRWCIQGGDGQEKFTRPNPTTQSHMNNLKKSASMAGMGVTPVQDKLYSTVFAGASKFCCRDCGSPFNTLVDLTVHMNKTGHFRDSNTDNGKSSSKKDPSGSSSHKPSKKPVMEDDNQNEKVLTCMGCGNLFDSLQDLSVHMIKTKHYENVPSLRMWSQKQTSPSDTTTPATRKRSIPTSMANYKKPDVPPLPPGFDQQSLFRPPFGLPPFMPGLNNPAAVAAYTSLLYSSPWLTSGLAPSMLPSLYSGPVGFSYPYLYPPGLFPGTFPQLPLPPVDDFEGKLPCTKCKESFNSLQKLSEHIQETSHFPDLKQVGALMGTLSSPLTSSPNSLESKGALLNPKAGVRSFVEKSRGSTSVSKSFCDTTSNPTSGKKLHRDYVKTLAESDAKSSASSLDFIRSLESTIKSAISKVESCRDQKPPSPRIPTSITNNSSHTFGSFFSTLADRPKREPSDSPITSKDKLSASDVSKSKQTSNEAAKLQNTTGSQPEKLAHNSASVTGAKHDCKTASNFQVKPKKSDTPLDLTLKREIEEQLSKVSEQAVNDLNSSIVSDSSASGQDLDPAKAAKPDEDKKFAVFSSLNQTAQMKSPIQCLHDMQHFFSLMKPKIEAAIGQNGTTSIPYTSSMTSQSRCIPSMESYKPIVMPSCSSTSTPNPLQEMLKIVNSTDLRKSRNPATEQKGPRQQMPMKRPSLDPSPVESKKSKFSTLLHDLVMPKDESPVSGINPLQKIQDLVDNKLHQPDRKQKPPAGFDKSVHEARNKSYLNSLLAVGFGSREHIGEAFSAAFGRPPNSSSLHSSVNSARTNAASKNGYHVTSTTKQPSTLPKTSNASNNSDVENIEKSMLEEVEVTLEDLELEATFALLFASTGPPSDEEITKYFISEKVRAWFGRMTAEYQSRGQLPFLRYHDNDGEKKMELLCRRCGMVFDTAQQFSSHVAEHIESQGNPQSKSKTTKSSSSPTTIRGKCTIQGALCIGPYKSFKEVITPENEVEDSKEESESEVPDLRLNPRLLCVGKCSDEASSNDETITVSS